MTDQAEGSEAQPAEAADTSLLAQQSQPDGEGEGTASEAQPNGEQAAAATEEKPAEGDGASEADDPQGPPEKYEFTAPEGVELDTAMLESFEAVARELGLTQESAQKLVDLQVKQRQDEAAKIASWREAQVAEIKADPKWEENVAAAKSVLNRFGDEAAAALFGGESLGNNKVVIDFLSKIGKAVAEDTLRSHGDGAGERGPRTAQDVAANRYSSTK